MRLLLALVLLAGCQPSLQRTVQSLAANGEFVEASKAALRGKAAGDPKAQELLEAAAEDAYRAELDRAHEAEADDELPESLAIYDRLIAFSKEVVAAGGPVLPEGVVRERTDLARRTATLYAARGAIAYEEGKYQKALDSWRLAEETDADATDAESRFHLALTRLGDAARDDHRYRDAITLYDEAVEAGGGEEPRVWAAAIHAALGRHALKHDACRKAVEELLAAAALPYDVRLANDLEAARQCSTREVVVHPFEDLVEGGLEDNNLGVLLVDQLHHHLRSHGSGFVVLLDPDSKVARKEYTGTGRRFDVRGHLTRVEVESGEVEREKMRATGKLLVPCEAGGEPRCSETLNVSYDLRTERLEVDIAGAIKVVDVVSGEQVRTRPVDIRVTKTRYEASDAKVTDARDFVVKAAVGVEASERQVGIQGDAVTHFAPSPPLPETDRVVDEAVVRLAGTAADAVLAAIDTEPPLADPETLVLVAPVTSADEITFGESFVQEHTPEDVVLEGSPEVEPSEDNENEESE